MPAGTREELTARESDMIRHLQRVEPIIASIAFGVAAGLLVLLSFPLGLNTYLGCDPSGVISRELGYASSVNWTGGMIILAPLFVFFLLTAIRRARTLPRRLSRAHMLVDTTSWEPSEEAEKLVAERWSDTMRKADRWMLLISLIGLAASLGEWWACSGGPLLAGSHIPESEIDWSVKFMGSPLPARCLNAGFSLLAYLLQACFLMFLSLWLVFAMAIAHLVASFSGDVEDACPIRLSPSLTSADNRSGFENFGDLLEATTFAAAFAYGVFYMSRLWNAYMHSSHVSFDEFVSRDFVLSFQKLGFPNVLKTLVSPQSWDYSGLFVTLGAFFFLVFCIGTLTYILRTAALRARAELIGHILQQPETSSIQGMSKAAALKRLRAMRTWPLGYINAKLLLLLGLFGVFSIVLYRIGIAYLGVLALATCSQVFKLVPSSRSRG